MSWSEAFTTVALSLITMGTICFIVWRDGKDCDCCCDDNDDD